MEEKILELTLENYHFFYSQLIYTIKVSLLLTGAMMAGYGWVWKNKDCKTLPIYIIGVLIITVIFLVPSMENAWEKLVEACKLIPSGSVFESMTKLTISKTEKAMFSKIVRVMLVLWSCVYIISLIRVWKKANTNTEKCRCLLFGGIGSICVLILYLCKVV